MKVVYTGEETPDEVVSSIFLAGPTPRDNVTPSWRIPDAIEILERIGYDGVVYVPEFRDRDRVVSDEEYVGQVDWEDDKLNMSDCIAFHVDRNLDTMPAFTTNHEHGEWFKSGKVVFGAPNHAPKNRYLQLKGKRFGIPQAETLEETLRLAVALVGRGALRTGGERYVPLQIWNTPSFQSWYADLKTAGNRLDKARVEWVHRFAPDYDEIFYWAMLVDIYITSEDRHKRNEPVVSRPDTSNTVLFSPKDNPLDTEIVLVREFRSPVSNRDGYVWELPGGSSFTEENPFERAVKEVAEETGLDIAYERFKPVEARQITATMSTHRAFLFAVELSNEEIAWLREQEGKAFGDEEATERTFVEVKTIREVLQDLPLDWANLGMIISSFKI